MARGINIAKPPKKFIFPITFMSKMYVWNVHDLSPTPTHPIIKSTFGHI